MNTWKLSLISVLAFASLSAVADDSRISERRAATEDGTVEISNVAGSVRIEGWRRNEVSVEGTVGEGVERVEVSGRDGHTVIRVHLQSNRGEYGAGIDGDAQLVVRVPHRSRMRVSTVSASIRAEGLDGPLELKSVSGDVDVAGAYTAADLQSVSGTVRVRGTGRNARVSASSISGMVQVDALDGELTGNTVSGTLRVAASGIRRASLKTVSGEVAYEGPLAADGLYEIEAISGTARLVASGQLNAQFELHTFSGSIRNAFGPTPERTSRYAPGHTLRFDEGQGSAQVRMRSISGTLHLRKK